MQELRGLAGSADVEPYLGFLHSLDPARPALALDLDLLEPLRSIAADRLALTLVNERSLTAAELATLAAGPGADGVILMPEALPRFLAAYEDLLSAPMRLFSHAAALHIRNWCRVHAASPPLGTGRTKPAETLLFYSGTDRPT